MKIESTDMIHISLAHPGMLYSLGEFRHPVNAVVIELEPDEYEAPILRARLLFMHAESGTTEARITPIAMDTICLNWLKLRGWEIEENQ